MIVLRTSEIETVMKARGLSKADVASAAGVDQRTVENALSGKSVSGQTIAGFLMAFAPLGFDDLFEVGGNGAPAPLANASAPAEGAAA